MRIAYQRFRRDANIHAIAVASRAAFVFVTLCCWTMAGALATETPATEASPVPRVDRDLLLGFLANPDSLTLIDARSPTEYSEQHLPGAVNVPHDAVDDYIAALPADNTRPIVVYCRTGRRAALLRDALIQRGYADVQVLPNEQIFWNPGFMAFNCSTETGDKVQKIVAGGKVVDAAAISK